MTLGTRDWFRGLTLLYADVVNVGIVQRQVSTFEAIVGGVDSRQFNQANNIHITFVNELGNRIVLRLEMLTGFTVMGQAAKCSELEDRLLNFNIRAKFQVPMENSNPNVELPKVDTIIGSIESLAVLRDKGVISEQEFFQKKNDLLSRI